MNFAYTYMVLRVHSYQGHVNVIAVIDIGIIILLLQILMIKKKKIKVKGE